MTMMKKPHATLTTGKMKATTNATTITTRSEKKNKENTTESNITGQKSKSKLNLCEIDPTQLKLFILHTICIFY